jgi:DNA integrity scanning protein DisA with diadenylate cyclase activity
MVGAPLLSGPARRLREELDEDGIRLPRDEVLQDWIVEELDYARRIPIFEGRRPLYGSIVLPADRSIIKKRNDLEIVEVDHLELDAARAFADGRSSFLVHRPTVGTALACFDRTVQYEADLVTIQEATGAHIVQRTAVLGVVRLFTDGAVVSWNGRNWETRPTAAAVFPSIMACSPQLDPAVARGVLELAVHWLAPARIGATFVVHEGPVRWTSLDTATGADVPALSLTNRRHYPAMFAALQQRDLATIVTAEGLVELLGVGLRSSREAEAATEADPGMRHRSARRFSYDEPTSTVVVVSEDGPVTVFRRGEAIPVLRACSTGMAS